MSEARSRKRGSFLWLLRAILFVLATLGLTYALVKLSYDTPLGHWVAEAIPQRVWQRYDAWYGPGDGEAGQDGELFAFIGMALFVATLIVSGCALLLSRLLRSS
jgi:ABC-type phosphate transport system permease subunit